MHTLDVVLERPALLVAAQRVTAAVDVAKAGRMKPVLGCLKLTAPAAGHGHPTLTGTDQAGWATAELPVCDPPTPGECLLPADKLLDILRVCTGPDLRVTAGADVITVRVGDARFELPVHDPAEHPGGEAAPDGSGLLTVDARRLAVALRRALAAIDGEHRRYAVNGACLDVAADGSLTLVGTDTKAISVSAVPVTGDPPPKPSTYLIPARAAKAVAAMAATAAVPQAPDGQPAPTVGVRMWSRGAEFTLPGLTVSTTLLEGQYPPYRKAMEQYAPVRTIPIDPAVLGSLVRQAKITTAVDSRRVTLAFAPGRLEVTGEGAGAGSASVTADLPEYDGPALVEAFDPDYLLAFCREAADCDGVTIGVPKTLGTGWTCGGGDGYVFVVMPLSG